MVCADGEVEVAKIISSLSLNNERDLNVIITRRSRFHHADRSASQTRTYA